MFKNNKILCLIPARGGSQGLPNKNIRLFLGKPLIALSIEQARNSKIIDRIIVSTDDRKIAAAALRFKAEVPFIRPARLSTANAKTVDVALHALSAMEKRGNYYDVLILLQPTSPLRLAEDIANAAELLFRKNAQSVISVSRVGQHPFWMNTLSKNGRFNSFFNKAALRKNRQELPFYYRINGAVYVAFTDFLKKKKSFFGKNTFAYIMPPERSIDIDTELDFYFAQCLKKKIRLNP